MSIKTIKSIDDGGPAFPLQDSDLWEGMTLRDYFAAQILPAIFAASPDNAVYFEMATAAYRIADNMMEARAAR